MTKIICLGHGGAGRTYLATSLACTFVIHAPPPALPLALIKDNKSWAERHKGALSKRDRRK